MNRRSILWAMTAFGLASLPGDALAQQKSLKEQLIGTWTFVSAVETSKDGTKSDRWGPNPKGLIIFDANGRYSFMISRSDIPKFAANNVNQGTAEENKSVVQGIIANIGTWSVDEASKTSHHKHRGGFVSQFEWEQPETNHNLAYGGRTEVHEPRLDHRYSRGSYVEAG